MALEYFPCYYSYRRKIAKLSDQEVGRLFRRLLEYGETGETDELTGREAVAFDFIADDIDRAKENYKELCDKNRANATDRKRTVATASDRKRTQANGSETSQTEYKTEYKDEDKDEEESIGAVKPPRIRFSPPTVEDVQGYCLERNNGIDPHRFVDFYEANGWTQGKGKPIKDWKAAVRTWESRQIDSQKSANPTAKDRYSWMDEVDL